VEVRAPISVAATLMIRWLGLVGRLGGDCCEWRNGREREKVRRVAERERERERRRAQRERERMCVFFIIKQ